ncbi:MAG: Ger(x)C family spore germination C-terminal domain-containing protein, partial [Clostridiaceae bacterium]
MIISEEVAKHDIISLIDVVLRDAEIRGENEMFISKDNTAGEILYKTHKVGKEIISYDINAALENQKSISYYPGTNFWKFTEQLLTKDSSPIVPCINLESQEEGPIFKVVGSGAFKKGKLVGYLDHLETRSVLLTKDEMKGGFIVVESEVDGQKYKSTLEIFGSKTKVKPEYKDNKLTMNIDIEIETGIIELDGEKDFIEEKGREILQKDAENN